jgi:hypothetical protein
MNAEDKRMTVTINIINNRWHFRFMHHVRTSVRPVTQASNLFEIFRVYDASIFHPIQKLQ